MSHRQCGGFVYYDSMYKGDNYIDLACLMCGHRWFVKKNNPFARWVIESQHRD